MTIIREGQSRSQIIAVPNGGKTTILYYVTHPPTGTLQYFIGLRRYEGGERITPNPNVAQKEYDTGNTTCGHTHMDLLLIKAGNCTMNETGAVVDIWLLMVEGNNSLNGTQLRCVYRLDGSDLDSCNDSTDAIIVVYDECERGN